ncbi:MAG: GerMN domain-containing protein [Pseudomonadota bacterium]
MIGFWRIPPNRPIKTLLSAAAMILMAVAAWCAPVDVPERASENEAPLQQEPVLLYFADAGGRALKPEQFIMPPQSAPQGVGRAIVEALVKGPSSPSLSPTLPAGVAVKGFYIAPGKTAVVDLDNTARDRHPGGIMAETLSIFSIVNALVLNMPDIEQVKVLFNGQEVKTFAGHIDLQLPLKANILLIR